MQSVTSFFHAFSCKCTFQALHLWEQAAALGQVSAMYSLAVWQLNAASDGDKTVDKMRALRLMRRAAAGGPLFVWERDLIDSAQRLVQSD